MDADALEDAFARVARRATDGRFPGAVALVARRGVVVGERAFGVRARRIGRGDDDRHDLRPRVDDEGARDRDGRDAARRPRQALADRTGRQVPAAFRRQRQGRRARARSAALLLRACRSTTRRSTPTTSTRSGASWRRRRSSTRRASRWSTRISATACSAGVIEAVAGTNLDAFAKREIWGPLGMSDTTYNPRAVARAALRRDRPRLARPPPRPVARIGAGRPGLEGRRHRRLRRRLRDRAQCRRSSAR